MITTSTDYETFKPIVFTITVETLNELKALRAISNISINNVEEHNTDFESSVLNNVISDLYELINDKYEEYK